MTEFDPFPLPGVRDPVSSLSHLLGAVVFALLTPALLRRGKGDATRTASLAVFAFANVFLLSMSGVYHLLPGGAGRAVLHRLDHGAIFVLIAGTFTPTYAILFRGAERWLSLLLVWAVAATGVTLKTVFFVGFPEVLGVALYLGMGWLGVHAGYLLWRRHGYRFIQLQIWGGLAYTAGAVLELSRQPVLLAGVVGPHELFHAFVLLGAALFWVFIYRFADGEPPPARSRVRAGGAAPGPVAVTDGSASSRAGASASPPATP